MFSVIIPVYNKARYVEKTIYSVLNQTNKNFELIIINDGSTDNSYDVLNEIIDNFKSKFSINQNNIHVYNQLNYGVSTTRNKGAEFAKYDFLAFIDADDWWEPTFLEEMHKLILDYPDAGMYGSAYYKIKNGQKIKSEIGFRSDFKRGYADYFEVYQNNFYYMPVCIGSSVISKNTFFEAGGFRGFLKCGEDFDLWIRIALKNKIAFINKHLFCYNQDVDINHRAMNNKLHPAESNFLFHTSDYSEYEKSNINLKILFDKFRTYSLLQYYVDTNRRIEAKCELAKVDWNKQPINIRLKYKMPIFVLKLTEKLQLIGSRLKSILRKII